MLSAEIEDQSESDFRDYLMNAAYRKRQGRYSLLSQEEKDRLIPLARSWCWLDEQREDYKDVLSDSEQIANLKSGKQETESFHQGLIDYAGTEEPFALIKALLRVQEATAQFLEGPDKKEVEMAKWSTLKAIKTVW